MTPLRETLRLVTPFVVVLAILLSLLSALDIYALGAWDRGFRSAEAAFRHGLFHNLPWRVAIPSALLAAVFFVALRTARLMPHVPRAFLVAHVMGLHMAIGLLLLLVAQHAPELLADWLLAASYSWTLVGPAVSAAVLILSGRFGRVPAPPVAAA